jgi:hypothetical protein
MQLRLMVYFLTYYYNATGCIPPPLKKGILVKKNYMIKYFINYYCGSDLLMIWLSLFLACQHLSLGMNIHECEDQSWFNVQEVPVFVIDVRCFRIPPGARVPQVMDHWRRVCKASSCCHGLVFLFSPQTSHRRQVGKLVIFEAVKR